MSVLKKPKINVPKPPPAANTPITPDSVSLASGLPGDTAAGLTSLISNVGGAAGLKTKAKTKKASLLGSTSSS